VLSVKQKSKVFEEIHEIRNKILPLAFIIICQHRNISFYFIFFTARKPSALFSLKWKEKEIFLRLEVYITVFHREWDRDGIGSYLTKVFETVDYFFRFLLFLLVYFLDVFNPYFYIHQYLDLLLGIDSN
jgi:hypothetical protein